MVFDRIINRLNRVFEKSPSKIDALTIVSTNNNVISLTNGEIVVAGVHKVSTHSGTIASLATELNLIPNILATAIEPTLLARCLIPDSNEGLLTLKAYDSLLHPEMQAVSWALDERNENIASAIDQLYMTTAESEWLDRWGEMFAIRRLSQETDTAYLNRIKTEITTLRSNNIAIQTMLRGALGINVDVVDLQSNDPTTFMANSASWVTNEATDTLYNNNTTTRCRFGIYLGVQDSSFVTTEQWETIHNIVNRNKAAGTSAIIYAPTTTGRLLTNTPGHITNNSDYRVSPYVADHDDITAQTLGASYFLYGSGNYIAFGDGSYVEKGI